MKIAIMQRTFNEGSDALKDACERLGHECVLLDPQKMSMTFLDGSATALYESKNAREVFDAILVRSIYSDTKSVRIYLEMCANQGIYVTDSKLYTHYDNSNKHYASFAINKAGLPTPKTYTDMYLQGESNAVNIANYFDNIYPIIVKLTYGKWGENVFLARSFDELKSKINELTADENNIDKVLFQNYIPHSGDHRIFVINDQVVGNMFRKKSDPEEYRSNTLQGGVPTPAEITTELKELAVKAAQATRTEIAGVDIIISEVDNKPYIIEVNRGPQFNGLVAATGIDIPGEIIKYVAKQAS